MDIDLDWNWFMAADFQGNWILTKGRACIETNSDNDSISGFLCLGDTFDENIGVYARMSGRVVDSENVVMTISSEQDGVPSFKVSGSLFSLEKADVIAHTFVLTDGTTVLGFSRYLEV